MGPCLSFISMTNSDPNLGGLVESEVVVAGVRLGEKPPYSQNDAVSTNPDLVPGTNRHKVNRSPNPTPYQLSPLSMSTIDTDARENVDALYGQRDPHYPILHESPEHRLIVYLRAQGRSIKEIADETGSSSIRISNVCRQPWAVIRIVELQKKFGHDEVAEILSRTATKAATALEKILDGQDERDSEGRAVISPAAIVAASKEILDRKYGKAKQPIGAEGLANLDMSTKSDEELMQIVMGQQTSTATS